LSNPIANLDLGVIGNCRVASLIDAQASMVWTCLPQFDSDPFFCSLLQDSATSAPLHQFAVDLVDLERTEQTYLHNTAILQTTLHDRHGGMIRITDCAPRYEAMGRIFTPMMLLRRIEPLAGSPRIRVRLQPANEYGTSGCETTYGSNHIRYLGQDVTVRLTTDVAVTNILQQAEFILDQPAHLILGPDESIPESTEEAFHTHFRATVKYWQGWSRGLSIPFEWQEAVIRAAITLKLCTFEDTGAVIAAMTTSIPEAAGSGRNWDYRFCWLRDSYFVVQALNRLSATKTMEGYLRYIINLVAKADDQPLRPLYGISAQSVTTERTIASLAGYQSMGPVRVGNQAEEQVQNDVYGAAVLSATQVFFDTRLANPGDAALYRRLEVLGEWAVKLYDQPDAGLWEYRGRQRVHTFSSVMCWAACDRLGKIAAKLGDENKSSYWRQHADDIHQVICERAWDENQQAFTESFGGTDMDASLLTLHELGFVPASDPRFISTVECIGKALKRGDHMFRYFAEDDFGVPENAFNICTFWYIEALAAIGRRDEAREMFDNMLALRNPLGLLSEDIDPTTNALWGNFPQTYSMAGIINAAVRLSVPWGDAL
jgi:GH15 family glucan-1,4-alpha-glucosidase